MKFEELRKIVAEELKIQPEQIMERNRAPVLVLARNILYVLLRDQGQSLKEISFTFQKDHSTILHGIDQFKAWLGVDKTIQRKYESIKHKINEQSIAEGQTNNSVQIGKI